MVLCYCLLAMMIPVSITVLAVTVWTAIGMLDGSIADGVDPLDTARANYERDKEAGLW